MPEMTRIDIQIVTNIFQSVYCPIHAWMVTRDSRKMMNLTIAMCLQVFIYFPYTSRIGKSKRPFVR